MRHFAGIDVAKALHWICLINESAEVLIDRAVTNTQEDIDKLIEELQPFSTDLIICLAF